MLENKELWICFLFRIKTLTVFSPSSSILNRPFAATVPNWVTSRQRELSEPACSFSLLCRCHVGGQHDPQEEGEEAESVVAAWSRGCWDKAMLARLAAIVKSSERSTPGYFFLLCCRRACSLCRVPDGFDPAPMEKEGVAGDPDPVT